MIVLVLVTLYTAQGYVVLSPCQAGQVAVVFAPLFFTVNIFVNIQLVLSSRELETAAPQAWIF